MARVVHHGLEILYRSLFFKEGVSISASRQSDSGSEELAENEGAGLVAANGD
jgi:hypothetical protein